MYSSTFAGPSPRWRNLVAAVTATTVLLGLTAIPVAAETPNEVAEDTAVDGVHVATIRRSDVDEEALIAAVEDARFDGLRIVISVPSDPQPDSAAFARRIQEKTDADIALVFPEEGPLESWVIEDLEEYHTRAITGARTRSDPADAASTFVAEISTEPIVETPAIVGQIIRAVIYLGLGLAIVVGIEQLIMRFKRRRAENSSQSSESEAEAEPVTSPPTLDDAALSDR